MRLRTILFINTLFLPAFFSLQTAAFAQTSLSPDSCNALFNLPTGTTLQNEIDRGVLNSTTCDAYKFLISRYEPGGCSARGLSNPQVQGITRLNPDFAVRIAKLFHAADAAGYRLKINSAYRTLAAQTCANGGGFGGDPSKSMHTKALAIDMIYPGDSSSKSGCDTGSGSAAYQWVTANTKANGLGLYNQLHKYVKGECNHMEPSGSVLSGSLPTIPHNTDGSPTVPHNPAGAINPSMPRPPSPGMSPGGETGEGGLSTTGAICPPGNEPVAVQNNDTGESYTKCVPRSQTIPGQGGCPAGTKSLIVSTDPIIVECPTICPIGFASIGNRCQPYGGCQPGTTLVGNQCVRIGQDNSSCTMTSIFDSTCQQQGQCTQGFLMINNRCTPFNQNQNGFPAQAGMQSQGGFLGSNTQGQGGFPQTGGSPFGSPSSGNGVSGGVPTQAGQGSGSSAGNPIGSGASIGSPTSQSSNPNNTTASAPGTLPSGVPLNILDRLNRLTHASDGTTDGSSATPQFSQNTATATAGQANTANTPGAAARDTADVRAILDRGIGNIASLDDSGSNSNATETAGGSPDTRHTAVTGATPGGISDASTFGDGRSPSSFAAQRGLLFRVLIELQTTLLGIVASLHLLNPTR